MTPLYIAIGIIIGIIIMGIVYFTLRNKAFSLISNQKVIAEKIIQEAEDSARTLKKEKVLEGKEEWFQQKKILEEEIKERQKELRKLEKASNDRLTSLDRRLESLEKKEIGLTLLEKKNRKYEETIAKRAEEVEILIDEQVKKLEEIGRAHV